MPLLENLPVDTEIPPEVRESFMQSFLDRLADALHSETTWALGGAVLLFLIMRKGFGAFTEARVRMAEAKRRLTIEDEAGVLADMKRLRLARQTRQDHTA
ncbi:MAG: hypothetical protein ACJAVR_001931 [Paracoccaceae bacterium]|jgi:hypothetical protein